MCASDRLMNILAEEGLARMPCCVPVDIETPCGPYKGLSAPPKKELAGAAGLTIDTPGRQWELLPEGLEAAVDW